MYQDSDHYSFETRSIASSITSNGFSVETSSQLSNLSRPSGKSIYMQRKEYVENINKQMGHFQYRVEHLFTCDMDTSDVKLGDCIERLNLLEAMGRVWAQDMILQVRDGHLLLIDIETKEELENHPVSRVQGIQSVLDSCVYNSLLLVSVQEEGKRGTSVFMFQCESLRADYIKRDLERAVNYRNVDRADDRQPRDNLRAIMATKMNGVPQNRAPPSEEWDQPEPPVMEWGEPDYDDSPAATPTPSTRNPAPPPPKTPPNKRPAVTRQPPPPRRPSPPPSEPELEPTPTPTLTPTPTPQPYTERERNVDILNHLINDIEAFAGRVAAVAPKQDKKKKKKREKKKKIKDIKGLPSLDEFEVCFQKIKFGFNLLGELSGKINEPSATDLVHIFFSILDYLVDFCPESLPPSVEIPLLTPECIHLMADEVTTEEDQFWQSLGDAWNIPSTQWADDDEEIPEYFPVFDDGWMPPDAIEESEPPSQPPSLPTSRPPSKNMAPQSSWKSPTNGQKDPEDSSYMRVAFDFNARNQRELSIFKGEVIQVMDMSKKWWKVRNNNGEEGYVPNKFLEPLDKMEEVHHDGVVPNLTKKSKAAEVKAWLEFKGFNKVTVRCLGMLSGASLLGMTRQELKMVCPDEGGRVFYQLQNVKSANALAGQVTHLE